MSNTIEFKDYERLTHWITIKLLGRAKASGADVEYNDLFQEVALIWCRCRDLYDETKGKFSLYYVRSAFKGFGHQNLAEKINGRGFRSTVSLNERVMGSEDEVSEFGDLIEDEGCVNPEDRLLLRESVAIELERNPLFKRLVELSVEEPPELTSQLTAMRRQREYARSLGITMSERVPTALTPELVRRSMRFNWRQRRDAQPGEIRA